MSGSRGALFVLALRHPWRHRRGEATFTRAHVRAARAAGLRPWVLFPQDRAELETTALATLEGVPSRRIRWTSLFRPAASILAASLTRSTAAAVVRRARSVEGPVVIHAIGVAAHSASLAVARLRREGRTAEAIASCYTSLEHEYEAKIQTARRWHSTAQWLRAVLELAWVRHSVARREAVGYQAARLVLVNYRSVDEDIRRRWPRVRTRLVPYSSERAFDDDRPPLGGPPDADRPPLVSTVAWHDPRKGWEVLLAALARLHEQRVPFAARLIGGGPLLEPHRRLARSLGLESVVRFEGDLVDSYEALRQADIFVLASHQEGSGSLALLEAFQAGLAVVVSAVDGLTEDVEDGVNGLLVPPGDPVALAAALARLFGDRSERRRLARAARQTFETRFTAAPFVAAIGQIYREMGLVPEE
jgi:glycosyltransferase involved in cell wall biosynthesis